MVVVVPIVTYFADKEVDVDFVVPREGGREVGFDDDIGADIGEGGVPMSLSLPAVRRKIAGDLVTTGFDLQAQHGVEPAELADDQGLPNGHVHRVDRFGGAAARRAPTTFEVLIVREVRREGIARVHEGRDDQGRLQAGIARRAGEAYRSISDQVAGADGVHQGAILADGPDPTAEIIENAGAYRVSVAARSTEAVTLHGAGQTGTRFTVFEVSVAGVRVLPGEAAGSGARTGLDGALAGTSRVFLVVALVVAVQHTVVQLVITDPGRVQRRTVLFFLPVQTAVVA